MLSAFISLTDAQPAVRKPLFEIAIGGASGGGLLGDVTGAIGLGGGEDPWQRSLESLSVDAGLAPFADRVWLTVVNDEHAPAVAVGDEGSVRLGFSDTGVEDVFTGRVHAIRTELRGVRQVEMINAGALLSSHRINQSYEQQGASDIIADLANQFGVDTDLADSDIELPFHVIDDHRNLYQHIAALMQATRQLVFVSADGVLSSVAFETVDVVQKFHYGVDIIDLRSDSYAPLVDSVSVVGEGAIGSHGADAWNWLVKDPAPVTATAGSGEHRRLVSDGSLRNADAVQGAAAGRARRAGARLQRLRITVAGAPAVGAGATVEIVGAPAEELNGSGIVYRIRHVYDKHDGLVSHLYVWRVGDEGFGGLASAPGGLL